MRGAKKKSQVAALIEETVRAARGDEDAETARSRQGHSTDGRSRKRRRRTVHLGRAAMIIAALSGSAWAAIELVGPGRTPQPGEGSSGGIVAAQAVPPASPTIEPQPVATAASLELPGPAAHAPEALATPVGAPQPADPPDKSPSLPVQRTLQDARADEGATSRPAAAASKVPVEEPRPAAKLVKEAVPAPVSPAAAAGSRTAPPQAISVPFQTGSAPPEPVRPARRSLQTYEDDWKKRLENR